MTFEEARGQFPVFERAAYLNAGSVGPLATPVHDAITAEYRRALEQGRLTRAMFDSYLEDRMRVRRGFADLLGVDASAIGLTTSTTEGCNLVVSGLGLRAGDEVVTTDGEHFGLIGPLAASPATVRVARVVERPSADAYDAILAEVTPRTKLIALSHVTWVNGHVFPWREVREQSGIPVLVDGAQSAGAIPVDPTGADFYTVSAQKWLCGPDLTGALYVREPDRLPIATPSYLSQREYDLAAATFLPQEDARRFDTNFTPFTSIAGLLAAFEIHPEWRYERAQQAAATLPRAARRTRRGRHRARALDAGLVPGRRRGGDRDAPRRGGRDRARHSRRPGSCASRAAGGRATRTWSGSRPRLG